MNEIGTQHIIRVIVDAQSGRPMGELDFALDFYIERDKAVHLEKNELLKVDDGYFALVDSSLLGRGHLMCRAVICDTVQGNIARKVAVKAYTGISFGERKRDTYAEYDNGYRLLFGDVEVLRPEKAYMFYGKVVDEITDFGQITEDMLLSPGNNVASVEVGNIKRVVPIEAGNKVVVLVPAETGYRATKDDGIGGKVPFDTSIMGANGELTVVVENKSYRLYGEFFTVGGEIFIYVD